MPLFVLFAKTVHISRDKGLQYVLYHLLLGFDKA